MFNSLFKRLFIGIWLVIIATAGISYAWMVYLQARENAAGTIEWRMDAQRSLHRCQRIARDEGLEGLVKWLRSEDNTYPTIYVKLLDDHSEQDVSGRTIPEPALRRLREIGLGPERGHRHRMKRAVQFSSVDGQRCVFFATRTESAPLMLRPVLPPGFPIFRTILFTLILTAAVSWLLARLYSLPLRKLGYAMARFADGDFKVRISGRTGTKDEEISELAAIFDKMAGQIEGFIERQQTLFHDVSHEVRSPLARMDISIAIAKKDPSRTQECLERIGREIEKVDELMSSLLTYARLGEDDVSAPNCINLLEFASNLAEEAAFEAKSRGIELETDFDSLDVDADVHEAQLAGAIQNISRNAVRYSPDGAKIIVKARVRDGFFEWSCRDFGPGVPDDDASRIFEPFIRGRTEKTGTGFGLGLAIARRAVERHGGTISAKNVPPSGLEVSFRIPL